MAVLAVAACSDGAPRVEATSTGSTVLRTERHVLSAVGSLREELAVVAGWDDRSRPIPEVQAEAVVLAGAVARARADAAGAAGAPGYAETVARLTVHVAALEQAVQEVAGCLLDCVTAIDAAVASGAAVTDALDRLERLLGY